MARLHSIMISLSFSIGCIETETTQAEPNEQNPLANSWYHYLAREPDAPFAGLRLFVS
jgi:hypothetical protein